MPLTPAWQEEIRGLLASDQRIAAVKRFREITGVGLAEVIAVPDVPPYGQTRSSSQTSKS